MALKDLSFHEASVSDLSRRGASIHLALTGVSYNDKVVSVAIEFCNVRKVLVDGVEMENVTMEFPDGEVLTLRLEIDCVEIIVEWDDFKNKKSKTRCYKMSFEKIILAIGL